MADLAPGTTCVFSKSTVYDFKAEEAIVLAFLHLQDQPLSALPAALVTAALPHTGSVDDQDNDKD